MTKHTIHQTTGTLDAGTLTIERALADWLADGRSGALDAVLARSHDADIAQTLNLLTPADAVRSLRAIAQERQARVFGYLDARQQTAMAGLMERGALAAIVSAMSHDERTDLFKALERDEQAHLLPALAEAEREDLNRLAAYAEGTAGSIMTSDYAVLAPDLTAGQALDALRMQAPGSETIYEVCVVDAQARPIGTVELRDLVLAMPQMPIARLMHGFVVSVPATAPREEAARQIARYDLIALPVIDETGRLVGIVTQDDAMDVVEEEATEDFHRVGTVPNLSASLRDAGIGMLYRARITWLVLLVFGNILSGLGIAYFEDTISAYVVLVFFLPLLIGSGGNAGSQSATLMVRALATGDVRFSDFGRMLSREIVVAVSLGLTMAVAVSVLGAVRGGAEVALVVALAMTLIVVIGSLVGMTLPFLLQRFRLDPATASAPLVTSITDAAGVLVYFGIATALLNLGG